MAMDTVTSLNVSEVSVSSVAPLPIDIAPPVMFAPPSRVTRPAILSVPPSAIAPPFTVIPLRVEVPVTSIAPVDAVYSVPPEIVTPTSVSVSPASTCNVPVLVMEFASVKNSANSNDAGIRD